MSDEKQIISGMCRESIQMALALLEIGDLGLAQMELENALEELRQISAADDEEIDPPAIEVESTTENTDEKND